MMRLSSDMRISAGLPDQENLLTNLSKQRYKWLTEHTPPGDACYFPGGPIAHSLFKASRYCYVYGYFVAVLVLGLAYIERSLQALLSESDEGQYRHLNSDHLAEKAQHVGLIDKTFYDSIIKYLTLRNSFPHLNTSKNIDSWKQNVRAEKLQITQEDARQVMELTLQIVTIKSGSDQPDK